MDETERRNFTELQRENVKLRLRLKKCMVWRREVRRLNKLIEYYVLRLKNSEAHGVNYINELQRLKKTMNFRPPWAPDLTLDGGGIPEIAASQADYEVEMSAAAKFMRDNVIFNSDIATVSDCDLIKPADNGSETTSDAPQSVEQDRPIWQQYPQLKE